MSKPLTTYNDFKNYKIKLGAGNLNNKKGGCGCNKGGYIDMNNLINMYLPKLKGGYNEYKTKKYSGGYSESSFNFFKDVMGLATDASFTNTSILGDLSYKGYNYPNDQVLHRGLF